MAGVQALLQNLKANKPPGPDGLHPVANPQTLCYTKLAPILEFSYIYTITEY